MWLRLAAATLLTIAGFLLPESLRWLVIVLHALAYIGAGFDIAMRAWRYLRKGRVFSDPLLVLVSALAMFFLGESAFGAMAVVLYRAAEAFRAKAFARQRRQNALPEGLLPAEAVVLRNGEELTIPAKKVRIGDTVLVRQGDTVPLDGVVIEGESELSMARLTGETAPVLASQGDKVYAGALNGMAVLMVRVTAAEEDSAVNYAHRISQKAREGHGDLELRTARYGSFYTVAVIASALLLVFLVLLIGKEPSPVLWLSRAMAMLAVSGSGAVLMAVSAGYAGISAWLFEAGCAVTAHRSIDMLAKLRLAAIDKAPLGESDCAVTAAVTAPGVDEMTLFRSAAIVYYHHIDKIALSLRRYCGDVGIPPDKYKVIPGYGVSASFTGQMIHAGSLAYMEGMGIKTERAAGQALYVALDNSALGYFVLSEALRPDAAALFTELREMGLRTALFTADPKDVAQSDAQALGADILRCDIHSRDKAAELNKLRDTNPGSLAYVGLAEDAGALKSADVGILCDGLRSPSGPEHCGAALFGATPAALPEILRRSAKGHSGVRKLLIAAVAVKCLLPVLAALGFLPIVLTVLADGACTVALTALAGKISRYHM